MEKPLNYQYCRQAAGENGREGRFWVFLLFLADYSVQGSIVPPLPGLFKKQETA
jgi:hypothetical protein